jgi:imidazoleglycerol phosphate synthase cyclase subunit
VSFVNLVDAGDPAALAAIYDAEGADELVFLDITATVEARATLFEAVARTAEQVFIPLTVGGGVRTVEDVQRLLRAGADKVSVNSAAVRDPELLSAGAGTYGVQCMVLAIDARRRPDGKVHFVRVISTYRGQDGRHRTRAVVGAVVDAEQLADAVEVDGWQQGDEHDQAGRADGGHVPPQPARHPRAPPTVEG